MSSYMVMTARLLIVAACCIVAAWAQSQQQYTTPIPILKQINRQNEDGSYSYGYEGADGSYKIETKHPTGEVYGKYGYVDDSGSLREIEYGANKLGFQPAGTGINVAPPTLPDPNNNYVGPDGVDDGQYREDPSIYYTDPKYNKGAPKYTASASRPSYTSSFSQQPSNEPSYSSQPLYQSNYNSQSAQNSQPAYNSQPTYNSQPSYSSQPSYRSQSLFSQQSYNQPSYSQPAPQYSEPRPNSWARSWEQPAAPVPIDQSIFRGHPASNFDVYTGSYSVNYK